MKRTTTRRRAARPAARAGAPRSGGVPNATLESVVGAETYGVWVDMLRALVPHGRTHRLSVVIAGMLHFAVARARHVGSRRASTRSEATLLRLAVDELDPERIDPMIPGLLQQLFRDARVSPDRVSARGERYSIVGAAIQEFLAWESMPWE